jgi:putative adenylate-forming enzyme
MCENPGMSPAFKTLRFLARCAFARARLRWFELTPNLYRKFHLALALPRWREFPFYRSSTAFSTFPEMNKAQLISHFPLLNRFAARYEECLEQGIAQEKIRTRITTKFPFLVKLSSGTNGRRGVFLTTESERLQTAATILAHAEFLNIRKPQKIALFLAAGGPPEEPIGYRHVALRFFDLSQHTHALLAELNQFRPTVLVGPPALLTALRIADPTRALRPATIVSVADKLEKQEKLRLEDHFASKVFEIYEANGAFLGISCREGTMHLNEDLLCFERQSVNDLSGAFEPVVSDYFRQSQAFVRFHLDDVLIPQPGICQCGSKRQAIREIRGRADDVLLFGGTSVPPDFIHQTIQNQLASDLDFKVIQISESQLRIQLAFEPPAEALARASSELRSYLSARGIEPPSLDWSFDLRRGPGDKRKRVERR